MARMILFLALLLVQLAIVARPTSAQQADPIEDLTSARRIYVPADELDAVIERDVRAVLLPRARFEELLSRARTNAEQNPTPKGVSVLVTSADYVGQVVDDQLTISVTAEIVQFDNEWHEIQFPLQRLALERATIDDAPALIGRLPDGSASLLLNSNGKHVLKLQLSTELNAYGSDRAAAFSLLRAPNGTFTISLPAGKRLIAGNLKLERPTPLDQPADYKISVGGIGGIQLRITDRESANAADSLLFATTGYGLSVSPGEVTCHLLTSLQVFGKPVSILTITVPNDLEIADVEAPGLEGWTLEAHPKAKKKKQIKLTFGQPFEGLRKVTIKGVIAVESSESWDVPALKFEGATSQIGQVVVQYPPGIRLQVEEASGVRRATRDQKPAADMPDDLSVGKDMESLRFDAWQPDFSLRFLTQPKQREVQSAIASVMDINSSGIDLLTAITVTTQFAPLFEVDLRVPSDWQILDVQAGGNPSKWQLIPLEAPGTNQIRVLLETPIAAGSNQKILISLRRDVEGWPVEAEPVELALPELILPQSSLNESEFVIRADADLDLSAHDVKGLDPRPLKADFERLRYQSQDTRYEAKIKVSRKPSSVSAQTVTFARIDPQTFHEFIQATVEVRGGGAKSLQIALPEATGTAVRFECLNFPIVEQKAAAPQDGERVWTLTFGQRLRGQAVIACDLELPRADKKEFTVSQARFVGAERQTGYLVFEAGAEQRLGIVANDANGTPLAEVDPLELPSLIYRPKERAVGVYRSTSPTSVVTLTEQRFEKLAVPTAICPQLEISTILDRTGETQHRASFLLKAIGVQGLHLTLPTDSKLWATLIDGQPVEVRRMGDIYLIPLDERAMPVDSRPVNPAVPQDTRTVDVFYRSESSPLNKTGALSHQPPVLTVESGQRTAMAVDVLERKWNLHYPSETQLVDSHGSLEPDRPMDRPSYLGRLNSSFVLPRPAGIIGKIALVIIAMIFVKAVRTLKWSRLSVEWLLAGTCIAVVACLLLPAILSARRYATVAPASRSIESETDQKSKMEGGGELAGGTNLLHRLEDQDAPAKAAARRPMPAAKPADGKAGPNVDEFELAQKDAQVELEKAPQQGVGGGKQVPKKPVSGLMSLGINFEPPAGSRLISFRYVGADTSAEGIPLRVDYVDQTAGTVYRIFLIALTVAVGWFTRRWNPNWRLGLAVLGLGLPVALAAVVSVSWQVALDGIFIGTAVVMFGWLVGLILARCGAACDCFALPKPSAALIMLSLVGLCSSATAEEKKAAAETPPAIPANTIVIPYDLGTDPLASDKVLLSREQFLSLYRRAEPNRPADPTAPQAGGIFDAAYSAVLVANTQQPDQSIIRVTARYAVRSFVDGQLIVELPLGSVVPSSVTLDGQAVALIAKANRSAIAVPTPGLHNIDLVFDVPAKLVGETGSFTIPLLPVAAGKLAFQLPAKDLAVRINGSSSVFRRVTAADSQSVELAIDKGGEVAVSWQPPQLPGKESALVQIESARAVVLSDLGASISDAFGYRIRQGSIAEVTFSLPEELRLQSVAGPDVGGWEIQGSGGDRKLKVTFRRNVTDQTRLSLETFLEANIDTSSSVVLPPQVAPQGISNEIGQVAVFAESQFTIRAEQAESLTQIDGSKFATTLPIVKPNAAPQLAYRYSKRPYTLSLRVARQESSAHVQAHQAALILPRKQQLTSRLRYNVLGSPRSSLSIRLPEKFVLLDVHATGLRDWYVNKQDDDGVLKIELNSPHLGLIEVTTTGFLLRDTATASIEFPQPIDASRIDTTAAVWLEEGIVGTLDTFEGWRSVDSSQIGDELKTVRANKPANFAFTTNQVPPSAIGLKLVSLSPKLLANGLSMVTVTDFAVVYTLALQWQIDSATTEALTVTTPDWLAGKLDFQGDKLRDVSQQNIDGGRTRWTIHLRSPVSGKYFVAATAALPPASKEVLAPAVLFEQDSKPLDAQKQYVLLINSSANQLSAVDATLVESVQPEDVPINIDRDNLNRATEFVRVKSPLAAPKWSIHTFQQQASAPASVNVADLKTVVSRDGTYRAQAVYTIKNRSRQFLAIRMPEKTDLLSVYVGGQPSRAVVTKLDSQNGAEVQLIALPKTSAADLSFPVSIVWRGRLKQALPKSSQLTSEELSFPAPQILSQQDDPDYGIPVARTRWTIQLPDDLDARPVRSTLKYNLSQSDASDNPYGHALVQETEELLSYLDLAISSNRRSPSRSNQKQIDVAMSNLKQIASQKLNQPNAGNDPELARHKAELLGKINAAEQAAVADRRATTEYFSKLESSFSYNGSNGLTINSNDFSSDLAEGQVIGNSQQGSLITRNGVDVLVTGKDVDDAKNQFGFVPNQVQEESKEDAKKQAKGKTKEGRARGANNETRQQLQSSNSVSLDALNSDVTEKSNTRQNRGMLRGDVQSSPSMNSGFAITNGAKIPAYGRASNTFNQNGIGDQSVTFGQNSPFSATVSQPSNQPIYQMQDPNVALQLPAESGPLTSRTFRGGGRVNIGNGVEGVQLPAPAVAGLQIQGVDEQKAAQQGNRDVASRQIRGLSLPIDLPSSGHELVFTKSGGDPKLTLTISSHESPRFGLRLLWSVAWAAMVLFVLIALRKAGGAIQIRQMLPKLIALIGILGYFGLPTPANWACFVLFVVALFANSTGQAEPVAENR